MYIFLCLGNKFNFIASESVCEIEKEILKRHEWMINIEEIVVKLTQDEVLMDFVDFRGGFMAFRTCEMRC